MILAKSYKPGGRCVAGRVVEYSTNNQVNIGVWLRPVANDGSGHGALTPPMYTYADGSEVKVLDIVKISLLTPFPLEGQPENFVINENIKWIKCGELDPRTIQNISEPMANIWLDPLAPSSNIVTTAFDQAGLIKQSLCLIKPRNLRITLSNEYNEYKHYYQLKTTASFNYLGIDYQDISVTCPCVRRMLKNKYPREGNDPVTINLHKGDDYLLCMSLSPRFSAANHHYKLVAAVFDYDGYLQRTYI